VGDADHGDDCPVTASQDGKWQRYNEHALNGIRDIPSGLNFGDFDAGWASFTFATSKSAVTSERRNALLPAML